MANVDNPHGFLWEKNITGGAAPVFRGYLKSNITVAAGDALKADGSGYIQLSGDRSSVLGVSMEAISSTGTHPEILFIPALDHIIFSGQTSDRASIGNSFTSCDMTAATGAYEVDMSDTSTYDSIRVLGLKDDNTEAGANAEVLFIFNKSEFGSYGRATS